MNMSLWFNAFGHRHFTVPPFHCPIVPPCRNFTRRRGHRANNLLCDLKHRSTVPAATPSHRATWDTVQPCHMPHRPIEQLSTLSKRPTVPPSYRPTVPPATTMRQPCRRDIWCATVAACRRRTDTSHLTHQHTSVHPRTCHTSARTWHLAIIPPYLLTPSVFFTIWSVAKIAMTLLMGFSEGLCVFGVNISQYCAIQTSNIK